jgi:single-strand DNA-binding protein
MNNINSFTGSGNLVRDPELRYTQSGTSVCSFAIASNRSFKQNDEWQEKVSYFNCTAWGKQADTITKYFKKGQQILIDGHLVQNSWDDSEGKKHYAIEIIVDNFNFCGKKESSENASNTVANEFNGNEVENSPMSDDDLPPF